MTELSRQILVLVVLPLWVAAGLADWLCHRRTRIEATAGVVESNLHLVLYAIVAAGGAIVLLAGTSRAVLAVLVVLWLLHAAGAPWIPPWHAQAASPPHDAPMSAATLLAFAAATARLNVVPLLEENVRCRRFAACASGRPHPGAGRASRR